MEPSGGFSSWLYPAKEELPDDVEMSLFDHLDELRDRILVSVAVVGAAILGCFAFAKDLIVFLEAPVYSQGVRFLQLSPGEYFFTTIKVCSRLFLVEIFGTKNLGNSLVGGGPFFFVSIRHHEILQASRDAPRTQLGVVGGWGTRSLLPPTPDDIQLVCSVSLQNLMMLS